MQTITILNGGLDEEADGEIVLRGRIALESFVHLRVDDYQREVAPLTSQSSILSALKNGDALPDIELGMRGEDYVEGENGMFTLKNAVYIIDGLQRVSTIVHYLAGNPKANIRIGAKLRFNTTKEWERNQRKAS